MTANGWLGYWILTASLLVDAGAAGIDAVWKALSRFGRAAAWVLGGIAVILLIIGATTALGVTR